MEKDRLMDLRGTYELAVLLALLNARKAVSFWQIMSTLNEKNEGTISESSLSKIVNRLYNKSYIERFRLSEVETFCSRKKYNYRISKKGEDVSRATFDVLNSLFREKL